MYMNNPIHNRRSEPIGQYAIKEEEDPVQEVKNKQINELSDMVKILLEEQRALKDKLDNQEQKMRDINSSGGHNLAGMQKQQSISDSVEASMLLRKQREITKKASERTRSQNP